MSAKLLPLESYRSKRQGHKLGGSNQLTVPHKGDMSGLDKLIENGGNALDEKQKKSLKSFEKDFKRMKKMAGANGADLKSDSITRAMYQTMLRMGLDLMPMAQEKYAETKSESSMYALLALVNNCKDMSNELRGFQDLEEQAEHIADRIIMPALINVTNNLLASLIPLKGTIDSLNLPPEDAKHVKRQIDQVLRDQASFMTEQIKGIKTQTTSYLIG